MKGRVSAANAPVEGARVVPPNCWLSRHRARMHSSGAGASGAEARGVAFEGAAPGAAVTAVVVTVVEPAANLVPVLVAACPRFDVFVDTWRFGCRGAPAMPLVPPRGLTGMSTSSTALCAVANARGDATSEPASEERSAAMDIAGARRTAVESLAAIRQDLARAAGLDAAG